MCVSREKYAYVDALVCEVMSCNAYGHIFVEPCILTCYIQTSTFHSLYCIQDSWGPTNDLLSLNLQHTPKIFPQQNSHPNFKPILGNHAFN